MASREQDAVSWEENDSPKTKDDANSMQFPNQYEEGLEVYQFEGIETQYDDGLQKIDEDDKQAINQEEKEVVRDEGIETVDQLQIFNTKKRGLFGMRKRFIILSITLLVMVALAAGLGAGISKKRKSSPDSIPSTPSVDTRYSIGGAIDPAYYSKSGAWNGSGIVFSAGTINETEHGNFTIFFQHHTGSIRYMQFDGSIFSGGSQAHVIASDAKNSTSIAVFTYVQDDFLPNSTIHVRKNGFSINTISDCWGKWHLFYIDKHDHLRQRSFSNRTNVWEDGPINKLNLTAFHGDLVGIQACFYGNFIGSTLKLPDGTNTSDPTTIDNMKVGMNLWFASEANKFEQYYWFDSATEWVYQRSLAGMNGRAGVGCYSWDAGTTTYWMMVDAHDTLQLWWQDDATNITSTEAHPISSPMIATKAAVPNVYTSSSLGYTQFLYAQMDDDTIRGFNVSFHAENSTMKTAFTVTDSNGPVKAIPGTHLTVTVVGTGTSAFFQVAGNDITFYTLPKGGDGVWYANQLAIPFD